MDYLHMRFPGGKPKAVTFSYDDGVRQDLRLAAQTAARGIKCTFNINSALVPETPGEGRITYAEIREGLLGKGHEAAIHGARHLAPGTERTLVGLRDALDCRLQLEARLGGIIRGMAYPNSGIKRFTGGSDYETVRRYLQDIGVVYARTLGGDNNRFELPDDWYRWTPTAHHNNPHTLDWAREFAAFNPNEVYLDSRFPRLFYLWGHSYEFDRDNNWDRLDALCEILGGRDDVWYATNIAIYDYVTAFRALVDDINATGERLAMYCSLETAQEFPDPMVGLPLIYRCICGDARRCGRFPGCPQIAEDAKVPSAESILSDGIKNLLSALAVSAGRPLVIFFDEVDCLSAGTLVTFLRQLRNGRISCFGAGQFPASIALIGMRNIRDFKAKIRPDRETLGSASPFNVITEAMTLRAFTTEEVAELYRQHTDATGQVFEPGVAALAYEYSRGQPYLVNALARWCMDKIHDRRYGEPITLADMHEAKEKIIRERGRTSQAVAPGARPEGDD